MKEQQIQKGFLIENAIGFNFDFNFIIQDYSNNIESKSSTVFASQKKTN